MAKKAKKDQEKKLPGRPETYTDKWVEENAPKIPDMMREGESIAEVCSALGMSKDTFYRLKKEYPEFSDAVKLGETYSEAWWAKIGRGASIGKVKSSPVHWVFNMKNRFGWKDKIEQTVEQKVEQVTYTPEDYAKAQKDVEDKLNGLD